MRWLFGLGLLPLLLCGGMCVAGTLAAVLFGRKASGEQALSEDTSNEPQDVS